MITKDFLIKGKYKHGFIVEGVQEKYIDDFTGRKYFDYTIPHTEKTTLLIKIKKKKRLVRGKCYIITVCTTDGCSVESVFVPNNRRGYEMLDKFYLLAEEENRQDWLVY